MKITDYLQTHPSVFVVMVITVSVLLIAIMIVFVQMRLKSDQKIARAALEIKKITNSVRAGVVNFALEDNYKILYASKGFYSLLGYTKEEAKKNGKIHIIDFLYQDDIKEFFGLKEMLKQGSAKCEVRMLTCDGNVIWMLMDGKLIERDSINNISAVFMDISEQKNMQRMLQIESERYRIASELSNDILFEYDIRNDIMTFSDKYHDIFGECLVFRDYTMNMESKRNQISPNDWEEFVEFTRKLKSGSENLEEQFRICNVHGEYVWCNVMGKTLYDVNHEAVRVIGKLVNVDAYKREVETLEVKATRDPLTNVYNKAVTGKRINEILRKYPEGSHLFMIVDIDDFKKVNDTYGHLQGDKVLIYVTQNIKKVFHQAELIGRIGGDEFVVFIANVLNKADILLKANTLKSILLTQYKDKDITISISGSIGIASYPQNGNNYEELLVCADKALYQAKKAGKKGFIIYGSEEAEQKEQETV